MKKFSKRNCLWCKFSLFKAVIIVDWKDIHPEFGGYLGEEKKEKWQELNFNLQQTKKWIDVGLEVGESEIAAYARWKDYQPSSVNILKLRKEYYQAQNWLNYYYPLEEGVKLNPNKEKKRNEVKYLDISDKNLEGTLNLEKFVSLEEFYCCDNRLTNLELSTCYNLRSVSCEKNELTYLGLNGLVKLIKVDCSDNFLFDTEFFSQLSRFQKLEELNVNNNNFSLQNLNFLASLVNLKQLFLGANNKKRIDQNIYNRFFGSLQSLQRLTSLEYLDISNTDIDSGVEYLPKSVEDICFSTKERSASKVKEIEERLGTYLTRRWLDKNYPKELRKEVKELKINGYESLKGHLDLSDFVGLERLDLSGSKITNLNLNNCKNLQLLNLSFNQLNGVSFLEDLTDPKKLRSLHLNGNAIHSDLFPFSRFVNLEELYLGNHSFSKELEKKEKLTGFYGSLKSLRDLIKLKKLDISNTDIDSGLRYLPASVEEVYCSNKEIPKSRVRRIIQLLKEDSNFAFQNDRYVRNFDFRDAQEWLEENYPKEKRSDVKALDISNKNLKNSLDLREFVNLESLECYGNQLTDLNVSGCLQLRELNCFKNQLTYLDVSKNFQLVELVCSENQLNDLKLSRKCQLVGLLCWDNLLTELDLSSLVKDKLEILDISANNFSEQDLSFLSEFSNLKTLRIGTYDEERIQQGIYNRFTGSLKPLQNMFKLEELSVSNTDINEGVEYLPSNIKEIYCLTETRQESKLKEIVERLENKKQQFQNLIVVSRENF